MTLEPEDLARLYETHAASVLRFFARRTLQADVAIDLVAETFARAFVNRAQFRGRGESDALAWLFGIARHELSAYFRRGAVERRALARLGLEVSPLTDSDYDRVEELADLHSLRVAVSDALTQLSFEHREALRLRIVEEQAYPEIARTLGVSETAVRARVSRALRALSKATTSLEGSPEHA
jgi:RNA polymerase sigma-70 factor, ECF subfamily